MKDLGLLLEWVCVCSVSKSWQVKSWQLRHWIVCFIGGVDRHIGWVSVDTSVNISAECQSTVVQGSVKYRLSICQRADWVSGYLWVILGPYNLSVDRLSIVSHYFVDGSPTYHQHWVDTLVDCSFSVYASFQLYQWWSYHSFVPLTRLVLLDTKKRNFLTENYGFLLRTKHVRKI